jgi:hypothetical protein
MQHIKKLYLYLVSVIALVIWVIGAIMLANMALKTWVFTKADNDMYFSAPCPTQIKTPDGVVQTDPTCDPKYQQEQQERNRTSQKQRDAAQAVSMILIASPVWYFHWRLARKEQ